MIFVQFCTPAITKHTFQKFSLAEPNSCWYAKNVFFLPVDDLFFTYYLGQPTRSSRLRCSPLPNLCVFSAALSAVSWSKPNGLDDLLWCTLYITYHGDILHCHLPPILLLLQSFLLQTLVKNYIKYVKTFCSYKT